MSTPESLPQLLPIPEEPDMQIGRLIKLVMTSLVRSIDARMQPLELTAMQWEPLLCVAFGKADTVAALARECNSDCGAMTRMLDRLEQKQLLARQRSDSDRRVVNIQLTDKGRDAAAEIPQVVREELQHHLNDFSPEERQALIRLLGRMIANATDSTRVQEPAA